jgi:hypothetical protein
VLGSLLALARTSRRRSYQRRRAATGLTPPIGDPGVTALVDLPATLRSPPAAGGVRGRRLVAMRYPALRRPAGVHGLIALVYPGVHTAGLLRRGARPRPPGCRRLAERIGAPAIKHIGSGGCWRAAPDVPPGDHLDLRSALG